MTAAKFGLVFFFLAWYLCLPIGQPLQRVSAHWLNDFYVDRVLMVESVEIQFYRQYALQPGCWTIICSHSRAYEYFAESAYENNGKNFIATQCNSISALRTGKCTNKHIPMGIDTPHTARGNFYLETNKKAPYGRSFQKYANFQQLSQQLIRNINGRRSK